MAERIITLASEFSGENLPPKGFPSRNMVAGTRSLFDFTDPICNPNADGNILTSAKFYDLVDGSEASIAAGSGAQRLVQGAGRSGLSNPAAQALAYTDQITLGTGQRIDRTKAFVVMLWLKQATDGITTAYQPWARRQSAANSNNTSLGQWQIDSGSTGANPRAVAYGGAVIGPVAGSIPALTRGVPHLLAMSFIPGVEVAMWHDGVKVGSITSGVPSELDEFSTNQIYLGAAGKGTFYRFLMEEVAANPTNDLRTAQEAIQAEWDAFQGVFV